MLPQRVRMETMAGIDELREARERIRDLKRAPADSHVGYCLEIACEKMGIGGDELKKQRHAAYGLAKTIGDETGMRTSIRGLTLKLGISHQNFY